MESTIPLYAQGYRHMEIIIVAAWLGFLWYVSATHKAKLEFHLFVIWGALSLSVLVSLGRLLLF